MANPFTPEQISQILEEFFKVVGTRQYIGARYVPIFGRKDEESIEWDNSAPYEPLTIVLYQGNSYTSRQYVPVGVEITNQEFWALTGNYNAQVEQYRRDVQAFDGRISANATAIDSEKTRAENAEQTLQDGINTNATKITENKKNIATNTNNIKTLMSYWPKTCVVIGDSYTQIDSDKGNWADIFCSSNGYKLDRHATSGMGFSHPIDNKTFVTLLQEAAANYTDSEKHSVEMVLCYGGINDTWSSEYAGKTQAAVQNFISQAKTLFPYSKIIIVGPQMAQDVGAKGILLGVVKNAMQIACEISGVTYINGNFFLAGTTGKNNAPSGRYYKDDNLHPNDDGQYQIAHFMSSAIFGGYLPGYNVEYAKSDSSIALPMPNVYAYGDNQGVHNHFFLRPENRSYAVPANSEVELFRVHNGNYLMRYIEGVSVCGLQKFYSLNWKPLPEPNLFIYANSSNTSSGEDAYIAFILRNDNSQEKFIYGYTFEWDIPCSGLAINL